MKVGYLLARGFDYGRMIHHDAGPQFADDYDWPTTTLADVADADFDVLVVDHRFQQNEMDDLLRAITATKATFVLRMCDPYWEFTRDHHWYRFVREMLDRPRVHVMLNYQPAEITALIASLSTRTRFVHAPFVYREDQELPAGHADRRARLFLSGSPNPSIYPLRSEMMRAAKWWPPLRLGSSRLEHPGYPDIGQPLKHTVVGAQYVQRLAGYRFAAVCSSRCRLEFLKYREFAYANVVPVGDLPATLLDCPADAWLPWRRNFVAATRAMRATGDSEGMARRFRAFMRERRGQTATRARVNAELAMVA